MVYSISISGGHRRRKRFLVATAVGRNFRRGGPWWWMVEFGLLAFMRHAFSMFISNSIMIFVPIPTWHIGWTFSLCAKFIFIVFEWARCIRPRLIHILSSPIWDSHPLGLKPNSSGPCPRPMRPITDLHHFQNPYPLAHFINSIVFFLYFPHLVFFSWSKFLILDFNCCFNHV